MTTSVLLTSPKIQFFDNNGDPLVGGSVYTYAAGTTTPQATYTDSGSLTQNANPIVLDSAGRADIWINGSYKIVVKDSSGTTISTTDNITNFSAASSSSTFSDASFTIQDNGDVTKQFMVQLSGLTTGTTTIMTPPDGNFTAVGTSATQTLTNKTLTSPTINTPKYAVEATVASATTCDLASGASNLIAISGTTTITSFGSNALTNNPVYRCRATGAFLLTYNGTSLILPGAANITTAAGDTFVAQYEGSGNWRITSYTRADGTTLGGGLTTISSGSFTATTTQDITSIPQIYKSLILYIKGASNTVATRALKVDVDCGNGFGSANNTATWQQIINTTITSVSSSNSLWTQVTQTAAQTSSCRINFPGYQSGPIKEYIGKFETAQTAGSEFSTNSFLSGFLTNNSAAETRGITGIRMTWDNVATGVFDGGTWALYGVM